MTKRGRLSVDIPIELNDKLCEYFHANHGMKSKAFVLLSDELLRLFKKDEAKLLNAICMGKLRILVE